jgi:hypothetical protein
MGFQAGMFGFAPAKGGLVRCSLGATSTSALSAGTQPIRPSAPAPFPNRREFDSQAQLNSGWKLRPHAHGGPDVRSDVNSFLLNGSLSAGLQPSSSKIFDQLTGAEFIKKPKKAKADLWPRRQSAPKPPRKP